MNAPNKTLTDIWNEVQAEQRKFNKIVRYMIGVLIITMLIAGVAALMSLLRLNNLSATYQDQIQKAQAQVQVSRAAAVSGRQRINAELLSIRQALNEQKDLDHLPRKIDQVIEQRRKGSDLPSFEQLRRDAISFAKQSAKGMPLTNNRAYLIQEILEEHEGWPEEKVLTRDEALLLKGVITYWQTGPTLATEEALSQIANLSNSEEMRGLGNSALAHYYHRVANNNPDDSLGWEAGCRVAVEYANKAERLINRSAQTLLAKGACLRKGGYPFEAFATFLSALQTIDAEGRTGTVSQDLVAAVHGTGTTLIALKSAETRDETKTRNLADRINALRAMRLTTLDGDPLFDETADELDMARALLNHAAALREKRGEGEIAKLFSQENIGYIYLLKNDWEGAIEHASAIDKQMARAWNLVVLIIALEQRAEDTSQPRSQRNQDRADAKFARLKLSLMRADELDEKEIAKLLHVEFEPVLREIVASINARRPQTE